jgi:hypothetical protein
MLANFRVKHRYTREEAVYGTARVQNIVAGDVVSAIQARNGIAP